MASTSSTSARREDCEAAVPILSGLVNEGVLEAGGGIGLFLLGMFVMTDGLKQLAGRSLRTALRRFTRSPSSGAATGAVATAIIQSSSATTVTAVGFVRAGLLTFGEAPGIIFGANIGGHRLAGGAVRLQGSAGHTSVLVLAGSLGRLFLRGRWSAAAEAVAGFGVIFIGIGPSPPRPNSPWRSSPTSEGRVGWTDYDGRLCPAPIARRLGR